MRGGTAGGTASSPGHPIGTGNARKQSGELQPSTKFQHTQFKAIIDFGWAAFSESGSILLTNLVDGLRDEQKWGPL